MSRKIETIFASVGERVTSAMEARDVSVSKLAELSGLTEQGIRKIRQGKVKPGKATLAAIARGLGLPEDFFDGKPQLTRYRIFLDLDFEEGLVVTEEERIIIKQHLTHAFYSIVKLLKASASGGSQNLNNKT